MPTVYVSVFLALLSIETLSELYITLCVDCMPHPHVTWPTCWLYAPPHVTWPTCWLYAPPISHDPHVDCMPRLMSHDPCWLYAPPHVAWPTLTVCPAPISHDPCWLYVPPHVIWPRCSMQTAATTTRWGTSELITLGGRGYWVRETCLPSCHTSTPKRWACLLASGRVGTCACTKWKCAWLYCQQFTLG